ncbi:MAG: alpha-amylase family protein [Bacteroidales bacterium]|nr:alpha-amylase family protein [Bacteroidales bacterium]
MASKFIIYQLLLRVFGNTNENCVPGGSLQLNGTGKFSSVTGSVLHSLKRLAVTHVWYTGVIEHVTKTSFEQFGIAADNPEVIKGEAGSPYAIKDYYDVNPYLADSAEDRMDEFCTLVKRTHLSGLKVIIDFIPNHLARGYNSDSTPSGVEHFGCGDDVSVSFSPQNNFYYLPGQALDLSGIIQGQKYLEQPARATGNDCFSASPGRNDWYETVKLNYGVDYANGGAKHFEPRPKTWGMMLDVLLFWASKGVDGFRCDMAEMVPVEFWNWAIGEVKRQYPHIIFIAEVYNPQQYGSYLNTGGFDYLYDKVGLYDNLKVITQRFAGKAPWFSPASSITGNWQSLGDMQHSMLNFLENHDEQRVASDFNIGDPFKAIPELTVSLMLNTAPFMLYFGQEFGERGMLAEGFSGVDGRTSIFDYCSAPFVARWLKGTLEKDEKVLYGLYCRLMAIAMGEKAIREGETFDLEYANFDTAGFNANDNFVFARKAKDREEFLLVAADFSQTAKSLSVKLPEHLFDFWRLAEGEYSAVSLFEDEEACAASAAEKGGGKEVVTVSHGIHLERNGEVELPVGRYGVSIVKFVG